MARVLIIEDSPLIVQMLTMVCEGAGHTVTSTEKFSGVAALLADSPEVIITDLNLPDVPGGDALSALKGLDEFGDTPIIIISGRPVEELEEIAQKSGAQGALSKDDGMPVISGKLPGMIDSLV